MHGGGKGKRWSKRWVKVGWSRHAAGRREEHVAGVKSHLFDPPFSLNPREVFRLSSIRFFPNFSHLRRTRRHTSFGTMECILSFHLVSPHCLVTKWCQYEYIDLGPVVCLDAWCVFLTIWGAKGRDDVNLDECLPPTVLTALKGSKRKSQAHSCHDLD